MAVMLLLLPDTCPDCGGLGSIGPDVCETCGGAGILVGAA